METTGHKLPIWKISKNQKCHFLVKMVGFATFTIQKRLGIFDFPLQGFFITTSGVFSQVLSMIGSSMMK